MGQIQKHAQKPGPPDATLFMFCAALTIFGLVILASSSATLSLEKLGNPWGFLVRQLLLGVGAGAIGLFIASKIPYRTWHALALPIFLGTILLLLAVFVPPLGIEGRGAARWIGFGDFTFQPGELAKFALVVYLASWLSRRRAQNWDARDGLIPFLAIIGMLGILLIMQPDVSTLGILALTAAALYFVAGTPLYHSIGMIVMGGGLLYALVHIAPYRMNRILSFLNPNIDPQGIGYQINQALLAIGSGGIFGRGLGFSRQKFFYLPEPMGDSVFAILAEELGFIGAMALITLFVLFALRGFRIAKNAPDDFGRFLAFGLTFWIVMQAFLNIAGNLKIVPLVGITLPFVSYGSSSLAITLFSVGVLLNISRYKKAARSAD